MTTGQIIKTLREERGMTQEQVAELMGYSHKSSINKIELGKSDLPQSKLVAFAKIFNVSPCELLGFDPQPATDEQIKEWDEKFNSKLELQKEVLLIEAVQKKYGKSAVQLLQLFEQLNTQGKSKAIDALSDLTDITKYTE
ncbi:MAG: XRE family transcriptional regulator [Clostridia bacterium]|nr:XRE family transcriptional regulator [Clostridia bacterium]